MLQEISWQAPEFIHYPKSLAWFIILIVAGTGLTVYFLFQKDFLTASLFLLLLLVSLYFSRSKPKTLTFSLDQKGISINQTRFPWQQLKTFWLVYEPPEVKTLNFETTALLNRYLTLQLENEDPVKIREFLLNYLPEDLERGESFTDKMARKLKF